MLTNDKINEIFCIADDFCKEFAQEIKKLKMLSSVLVNALKSLLLILLQ